MNYLKSFLIVFMIIIIFSGFDFWIHSLSTEYDVPSYYFRNKIIFGTLIGYITYILLHERKLFTKSLLVSICVSVLLQVRYYIEGYPLDFVLVFLALHFIILWPVSYIILKYSEEHSTNN